MRTDSPKTAAPAVARLRAEFARARRRLASRPPALRWSLGLAGLAALVALAYALNGATTATPPSYVRSGDSFSKDDLLTVTHALDAKHIHYVVDTRNRVQVAADSFDAATDVISKLGVGPRSLSDIEKWAAESGLMDTLDSKDRRKEQATNAALGAMIRRIDGVVAADVWITRTRGLGIGRPAPSASVFVYLETRDDRVISSAAAGKIEKLVTAFVPEVKPGAVRVFDTKGNHYLDPRDPTLGDHWKNRAIGEEWRQEIHKELDGLKLKGVDVTVQLVPAPVVPPPVSLPPLPTPAEEVAAPPSPTVGVNEPLELTPERPGPARAPVAVPPLPPPAPATTPDPPKARVWVKVPRSFYLKALNHREQTLDDVPPLVEKMKGLIETAVRHVVPPGRLEEPVLVSTFPDDLPAREAPAAPGTTDPRRVLSWWVAAGLAGGTTAALLGVAFRVLVVRRPAPRPARPRDDRGRFKIDEASDPGPGPSERVRELIRISPEAAASVLHRWTGQGGAIG